MSTARTTPAQKPRGRTRRSTFPLVSVGIFFLSEWFIKTLSYLRGGVCWMEIGGGGVHRKAGRLQKAGPTTARAVRFGAAELAEKVTAARAGYGCESPRRPASTSPRPGPACRDESRVRCRLR